MVKMTFYMTENLEKWTDMVKMTFYMTENLENRSTTYHSPVSNNSRKTVHRKRDSNEPLSFTIELFSDFREVFKSTYKLCSV